MSKELAKIKEVFLKLLILIHRTSIGLLIKNLKA